MPSPSRIDELRKQIISARSEREFTSRKVEEEQSRLEILEVEGRRLEVARGITQKVAETIQNEASKRISSLVTHCLAAVFPEPYVFEVRFERKRGKTEARLLFSRGELEIEAEDAAGGGVIDVAAFALRVSCLLLSKPRLRPCLFLDEPFRFVSAEYRPAVRGLLESLSADLGVQIVMVTHFDELRIGKVLEIGEVGANQC